MITVFYHAHCTDGLAAAHTARTYMQRENLEAEYVPVNYGEPLPRHKGSIVYFVDWCPTIAMIRELKLTAQRVIIIDHHETAFKTMASLKSADVGSLALEFKLNSDKCGCILTAEYFDVPIYRELKLIDDRDRWQHVYGEETLGNYLCMTGISTLDEYDAFIRSDYNKRQAKGRVQVDLYMGIIRSSIPSVNDMHKFYIKDKKIGLIQGLSYPLVSDGCHFALKRDTSLDAVVAASYDIVTDTVHMSWRSCDKKSAFEMATMFEGGGGHPDAAGARCSLKEFKEIISESWPSI